MITTEEKEFESENFAMQIIARGGFVDCGTGDGQKYYVDTINLRANHIMSNEYIEKSFFSFNDWEACYETKEEEWENDKREKEKQSKAWEEKVKNDLKTIIPNIYDGTCLISKVHLEFFAVMHVYKMKQEEREKNHDNVRPCG